MTKEDYIPGFVIEQESPVNFDGLIDEDILERFKDSAVYYGDIINAQLIKTNKLLIKQLKEFHKVSDD